MIELTPTHLIFSGEHENLFSPGDIISIQYNQEGETITPILGLTEIIKDEKGYKVTKQHSILFKGKFNNFLSNYGCKFNVSNEGNYYKLIPLEKPSSFNIEDYKLPDYNEEILDVDKFEIDIINNKL